MNYQRLCCIVAACLCLSGISHDAAAVLLGSAQLPDNNIFVPSGSTSSTARLRFMYDLSTVDPRSVYFDEELVNGSAGTTFTYSSGSDFDKAVALLTNGINDSIYGFASTFESGSGQTENNLFADDMSLNGIDFSGYNVTSFQWVIDAFSITNGNFAHISSSIYVYGSVVPVPAAVWLFGSGLLGLVGLGVSRKGVSPLF
jgi:hypothetical protein